MNVPLNRGSWCIGNAVMVHWFRGDGSIVLYIKHSDRND